MTRPRSLIHLAVAAGLVLLITACGDSDSGDGGTGQGEVADTGETDSIVSDGAEESGIEYARDEAYDETRRGARLRLRYDDSRDTFVGTVENTTTEMLDEVRVEVHLSNGTELGPTTPGRLEPGDTASITLPADGESFEAWSAHPEVGRGEHGEEGEGGEHEGEESGEHDGE